MSYRVKVGELRLLECEVLGVIDKDSGEVREIKKRMNNLPDGKSPLVYDSFSIFNTGGSAKLLPFFSNVELGVIMRMVIKSEYGTNSLRPFNDESGVREIADEFGISKSSVGKIFQKLFQFGVYLQLKVGEVDGAKEYWVLNPNISWKGRLRQDSLFAHFANTLVTKIINGGQGE
jgi:hypothetical protein